MRPGGERTKHYARHRQTSHDCRRQSFLAVNTKLAAVGVATNTIGGYDGAKVFNIFGFVLFAGGAIVAGAVAAITGSQTTGAGAICRRHLPTAAALPASIPILTGRCIIFCAICGASRHLRQPACGMQDNAANCAITTDGGTCHKPKKASRFCALTPVATARGRQPALAMARQSASKPAPPLPSVAANTATHFFILEYADGNKRKQQRQQRRQKLYLPDMRLDL